MASITIDIDEEQLKEVLSDMNRQERLDFAWEIIQDEDPNFRREIYDEMDDEEMVVFVKKRLDLCAQRPTSAEEADVIRAVLEHAIDAAKKIGIISDGPAIVLSKQEAA